MKMQYHSWKFAVENIQHNRHWMKKAPTQVGNSVYQAGGVKHDYFLVEKSEEWVVQKMPKNSLNVRI